VVYVPGVHYLHYDVGAVYHVLEERPFSMDAAAFHLALPASASGCFLIDS
jgi:hypothetical protein